jgi:hypothetical protein
VVIHILEDKTIEAISAVSRPDVTLKVLGYAKNLRGVSFTIPLDDSVQGKNGLICLREDKPCQSKA